MLLQAISVWNFNVDSANKCMETNIELILVKYSVGKNCDFDKKKAQLGF